MFDFIGVSLIILLLLLFGWLTSRTWRLESPLLKWFGTLVTSLLTIAVGILLIAAFSGYWLLNKKYDNPILQISVVNTPELISRGEKFKPLCAGCHGNNGALTGRNFLDNGGPPIGTFYTPNLTPLHLLNWSDGEIIRAIREGVHRDGRSLLIMPSEAFINLSDRDVQAIVAYLRSLEAEGPETPSNQLNVLGAILSNMAPIFRAQPAVSEPVIAPPYGATASYGSYLSSFTCNSCHGVDLMGNVADQTPPLVTAAVSWGEQNFIKFMRTGKRPDGSDVDGEIMPWKTMGNVFSKDDELRAIYSHLQETFRAN